MVGTDEAFFEDEADEQTVVNLYHERADILDGEADGEVDLASHAYQIWKNAISANPKLEKTITSLQDVAFSSRLRVPIAQRPEGVLVFVRTADGNDSLAYIDREGNSINRVPNWRYCRRRSAVRTRRPSPATKAITAWLKRGVKHIAKEEQRIGGQLGRPSGARRRVYDRLKTYADSIKGQLFDVSELHGAIDDIYRYPLRQKAADILNRQLRIGIDDAALANMVIDMRDEDRLCQTGDQEDKVQEPRIICSLGASSARRWMADAATHQQTPFLPALL